MYNVKLTISELVDLRMLLQKAIKETKEEIETYSQAIVQSNDSKHIELYNRCKESCNRDIESYTTILNKLYNA